MSTFEAAQADLKKLKSRPSNEDMLFLYAHYKQGTSGEVDGKRPGMLDMIGRAKYDAWAKLSGLSNAEAQSQYVAKVSALLKADS